MPTKPNTSDWEVVGGHEPGVSKQLEKDKGRLFSSDRDGVWELTCLSIGLQVVLPARRSDPEL